VPHNALFFACSVHSTSMCTGNMHVQLSTHLFLKTLLIDFMLFSELHASEPGRYVDLCGLQKFLPSRFYILVRQFSVCDAQQLFTVNVCATLAQSTGFELSYCNM
jgi:hypothetical protein